MDEQRLLALEAKLDRIEKHCSNMTAHIGFVERVYNVLRAPEKAMLGACQSSWLLQSGEPMRGLSD